MPKFKITGLPRVKIVSLPKAAFGMQSTNGDPDDEWIKKILQYESTKGSSSGGPLSNFGYNSWQKLGHSAAPTSIDEAVAYFKQDYLPKVQQYPMGMRERMADYMYNTGRSANDLLLYNAGKIDLNQLNSKQTFDKEWQQYGPDIQKMFSDPNFINKLDESKDAVYKTTKQENGQPNSAYEATWKGRLGLFPKVSTTSSTGQQPTASGTQQTSGVTPGYKSETFSYSGYGDEAAARKAFDEEKKVMDQRKAELAAKGIGTATSTVIPTINGPKKDEEPEVDYAKQMPNFFKTMGQKYGSNQTKQLELAPGAQSNTDPLAWQGSNSSITGTTPDTPTYNVGFSNVKTTTTTTVVSDKPCPRDYHRDAKTGQCVPNKVAIGLINDITQQSLALGNVFATAKQNAENKAAAENSMRRKSFNSVVNPGGKEAFGHVETVSGIEYPNMMTPPNEGQFSNFIGKTFGQFGGSFLGDSSQGISKIKILNEPDMKYGGITRIKILDEPDEPQMKYGGQSNYGFDSGWRKSYTEMNKTSSDHYTNSMSEKKGSDEKPVLEAEGGETIYKPGDGTFFNLNGPKHTHGGIKLTADQVNSKAKDLASFIYSDTAKLKIKDEETLKHFGFKYKKGGITPAAISKRFDLNKYKAILQDPDTDNLNKDTAQLGMDKNKKYLAELAAVQEQMKGNEMPEFAKQILQPKGQAKFGGYVPNYEMAYGGDVPEYAIGGLTTDTTTKAPTEGAAFTPEQIAAMKGKKVTVSGKMKSGIATVPYHQNTSKTKGYYGDVTPSDLEDLKQRHPWYFNAHPDWDPANENDVDDFQKTYDEAYAKKNGYSYFVPKGSKEDRKFNRFDKKLGRYTYDAPALDMNPETPPPPPPPGTPPPGVEPPRYICIPNGRGGGVVKQLPPGSTMGYTSAEEAGKHCGEAAKRPPFDYLLPDKVNMLAHAAVFPRQIFPYYADLPYNKNPLALEDWRAKAAQRFSTQYAAPSAQLATFGPTQGLAANLSFLAGQTGQQMAAEDIAPTISRNVDRVNTYNTQEAQRQDAVTGYNAQNKDKRYAGYATTLQNYDNALRGYLKENSDAFTRAWKNRLHLDGINMTNPDFYVDPFTGRQISKGNKFSIGLPRGLGGAGVSANDDMGKMYGLYYSKYLEDMKSDIPDETERKKAAREMAMEQIKANRYSETSDPYSNKTRRRTSGFDFGDGSDYQ
jgi:hypothetical protein